MQCQLEMLFRLIIQLRKQTKNLEISMPEQMSLTNRIKNISQANYMYTCLTVLWGMSSLIKHPWSLSTPHI